MKTSEKLGEWNDKVTQSDLWVPWSPQHHLPVPRCLPWSVLLLVLPGSRACLGAGGRLKQDCYLQHAWLPAENIPQLQRRWVKVSAIISVMVLLLQKKNSNQLPDHILCHEKIKKRGDKNLTTISLQLVIGRLVRCFRCLISEPLLWNYFSSHYECGRNQFDCCLSVGPPGREVAGGASL